MRDKFGTNLARMLGEKIQAIDPSFSPAAFLCSFDRQEGPGGWAGQIAETLAMHLPPRYPDALNILLQILGPEHPAEQAIPNQGHKLAPVARFVAHYGLDHFTESMQGLAEIAKRSHAAQVSLREFIVHDLQRTYAQLQTWTHSPNAHIRHLVSDATRPRLRLILMPGVTKLEAFIADPEPLLDLLENLRDDPSPMVRKSVAGNLSDILKYHPDPAYQRLARWQPDAGKERRQIIRGALKYSLQKGDSRALALADKSTTTQ